ncbi:hypothetical protein Cni_G15821 [Canna indica]|uniref:Uncharacterized protein n=1 Tax=Canna indica TaxID=4628 RepID=A0AAQ3KGS3_9LILI|nr:hypothetical protein Cni_G15821 [Canna indica]
MEKRVLPVLHKEDNKLCEILNQKCKRWHPWMRSSGKDLSKNVKTIADCMIALNDGLKVCIVNGKNTNIWKDPWIGTIPLEIWPTFINVKELEKHEMVFELIKDKKWNADVLNNCFRRSLKNLIEEGCINEEEIKKG